MKMQGVLEKRFNIQRKIPIFFFKPNQTYSLYIVLKLAAMKKAVSLPC